MNEDYYVLYGNEQRLIKKTDYDTKENSLKEYNRIKLGDKITWKEMWYEPLEIEDEQILIHREERKVTYILGKRVVFP